MKQTIMRNKPEINKDTILLTCSCAKHRLAKPHLIDGDETYYYHTFQPTPIALIGADISEGSLDKTLEEAQRIEIAGENAMNMGHGIAVITDDDDLLFIEHDPEKMKQFLKEYEELVEYRSSEDD